MQLDSLTSYAGRQSLFITNAKSTKNFGGAMLHLPHNLSGDSIELSAMIKLKDVDSSSSLGFMLRIDPGVFFDNLMEPKINGTHDWREFKIKAKLKPNITSTIALGIFLSGQGKIWADNVKVMVDGEDITTSSEHYIPFAKDYSRIGASGVNEIDATKKTVDRLADLGRIWGLLKYRHPTVALGEENWDNQLFQSINLVASADNKHEIEQHYMEVLDQLGISEVHSAKPLNSDAQQTVDYEWIDDLPYTPILKNRLKVYQHTTFEQHHYIDMFPGTGGAKITGEFTYEHLKNPDVGFRLLSLFRYWNIIQYLSPYRSITDTLWNDILSIYIPKMIQADEQIDYLFTATAMLGEMKDAHTQLWSQHEALKLISGDRSIPVRLKYAEGKPVVKEISLAHIDNSKLRVGDVIIRKNGRSPEYILDSLRHLLPTPNQAVIERELSTKIARSIDEIVYLDIERNGEQIQLEVEAVASKNLKFEKDTVALKRLVGNILYINHGYITRKDIDERATEIKSANGLIIDIRNYPRDFVIFELAALLLPRPTPFVKFTHTGLKNIGDFHFTKTLEVGTNTEDYYKGKVAILIDESTQSSAEYHSMAYRMAPHAKVFGSQTAGADGNTSAFYLPGGLYTTISGIGVFYPDGKETQRIGIVPDVLVKPTIQGIRDGQDEVLQKALEYLDSSEK
ncbi:S41 family peptidase [Sphingobacterium corticis]|uniref:S41 family peptidase n=1 Tax=Sphingobacterium corticis TaxID=1812823 RepID=A0ABW5NII6_9SPHI